MKRGIGCLLALATLVAGGLGSAREAHAIRGELAQLAGADGCLWIRTDPAEECLHNLAPHNGGVRALTVADGHVYVATTASTVLQLARSGSGALSAAGSPPCVTGDSAQQATCTLVSPLLSTDDIAASPDGAHVYVSQPALADVSGGYITVFSRDATTGQLTRVAGAAGCVMSDARSGTSCGKARAFKSPREMAFDAAGSTLYVADSGSDAVLAFARDAGTGALTQLAGAGGCIAEAPTVENACADGRGLDGVRHVRLSLDGEHLYAAGADVTAHNRLDSGGLSQLAGAAGCVSGTQPAPAECATGTDGGRLAIAPDGANVYVAASGGVGILARDSTSGGLQPQPTVGSFDADDVVIARDGRNVYASSPGDGFGGVVHVFARGQDGALTRLAGASGCHGGADSSEVFHPGCTNARGLRTAERLAFAGDGTLYAGSSHAVAVFDPRLTPLNTAAPLITGNEVVGGELFCSDGTWFDAASYAYTWTRDGEPIEGTAAAAYRPVAGDEGRSIGCTVSASNADGAETAHALPVQILAPTTGVAPSIVELPRIDGTVRDEEELAGGIGLWDGTPPLTYARQWLRCDADGETCEEIADATGERYALTSADVGRRLRLRVTATNTTASVPALSVPTAPVAPAPPRLLVAPVLSGTPEPRQTVSIDGNGSWRGTPPISFTRRWVRCRDHWMWVHHNRTCTALNVGDGGTQYEVTDDDKGSTLHVEIIATNAAGSVTASSNPLRVPGDIPCDLANSDEQHLCGKTPIVFVPGFGASELNCTNAAGLDDNLWPDALTPIEAVSGALVPQLGFNALGLNGLALVTGNREWEFLDLAADGVSPGGGSRCSRTVRPTGKVMRSVFVLKNIHGDSMGWLERIAPGHAYEFGWDWRKGPDQTVGRLNEFIDGLRARHGVQKVAILNHSYGGILTQLLLDDPARARKVARVANLASPYWGAPKAWLALAHGIETPALLEPMDMLIDNARFKDFTRNLTGLYYLFPSAAWFESAPAVLRKWLEIDEQPRDFTQTLQAIERVGGNRNLAEQAAEMHRRHLDGFRTNGVDYRIFVGSGLPTLGHIRDGGAGLQYSWVNGDGTVPLVSQRQFADNPLFQLGDDVKTYYYCGVEHMKEPEEPFIQQAIEPFLLATGDVVIGGGMRTTGCALSAHEFRVTGHEDTKSVQISAAAEGRAAAAPRGALTLPQAEAERLLDHVEKGEGVDTFVTHTARALNVRLPRGAAVTVTPVRPNGRKGRPVQYGPLKKAGTVTVRGAGLVGATVKRNRLDRRPPRTRARVRGRGRVVRLSPVVRDASRVTGTFIRVGRRAWKRWRRPVRVPRAKLRTVRVQSVDAFGNIERPHRLSRR